MAAATRHHPPFMTILAPSGWIGWPLPGSTSSSPAHTTGPHLTSTVCDVNQSVFDTLPVLLSVSSVRHQIRFHGGDIDI